MPDRRVALHVGQLLQAVPGGIGRYTQVLATELTAAGLPVTGFAAGPRPPGLPDAMPYVDLGRPGPRLRYESWLWLRRPGLDVEADVVHAPSLAVPPPGDRPLVVTVHDIAFLRLPQYFTVHGLRFHERGLNVARKEATAIIVPSRFVAEELEREGFEPERVHVAHHGIDPPADRSDAEIDEAVRRWGITGPYVLFVGTLEPRKGVATLVGAFAHLRRARPDVSLVVVGGRGWGQVPRLDRPGILALGGVGDDDLDALYRRARCLAYPSHYEGFGLPVLEAMVRGCPVITSSVTSLPEVAGDAAVMVEPEDVDGLATALQMLVDDDAEAARLSEAGRARAATFTWASSVATHMSVYRTVVGARTTS